MLGDGIGGAGVALASLPTAVGLALFGGATGVAAMLVYRRFSPQARLGEVRAAMTEARARMHAYDGTDVGEVLRLARRSVGLALRQLRMVLLPSLVAAAPVVAGALWLEVTFAHRQVLPFGPGWLRGWEIAFFGSVSVAVVAMKVGLRIR